MVLHTFAHTTGGCSQISRKWNPVSKNKIKPKISKQNKQTKQIKKRLWAALGFFWLWFLLFWSQDQKNPGLKTHTFLALLRYLLLEQHLADNLSIVFAE